MELALKTVITPHLNKLYLVIIHDTEGDQEINSPLASNQNYVIV